MTQVSKYTIQRLQRSIYNLILNYKNWLITFPKPLEIIHKDSKIKLQDIYIENNTIKLSSIYSNNQIYEEPELINKLSYDNLLLILCYLKQLKQK